MIGSTRNTVAVGLASLLSAVPLLNVSADVRLLPGVVLVVTLLQGVAVVVRRRSPRAWLTTVAQLACGFTVLWIAAATISTGPAGQRAPWNWIGRVLSSAGQHISEELAPMPAQGATLLVLLGGVGLLTILVDVAFIGLRSVLLAVLPLLGSYATAMAAQNVSLGIGSFVAVGVGWLILLAARTLDHERRWPRGLSSESAARLDLTGFGMLCLGLGAWALATTVVAGLAIPATGRNSSPTGSFGGDSTVQLTDPSIELNQNLRRGEDRPVLTYTTTSLNGVMLRTSALTAMNESGWQQISMSLQGGFPANVPGLGSPPATTTTQVHIGEFTSNYLPVPYAPLTWQAAGDWSYDPVSLTVLNVDRRRSTDALSQLSYSVASIAIEPSSEQLTAAIAGIPPEGEIASQVPPEVPQPIIDLAKQITAQTSSDGQRAVALQNWLRDPTRFTYDLSAPDGTGYAGLVNFLTRDYRGYCVHFAASMALMARVIGIPARVATGFTTGTQQDDGSWLVTSHNMHAWPELYFAGLGWVRFEPTAAIGTEPGWTRPIDPAAEPTVAPPPPSTETAPPPEASEPPVAPAEPPVFPSDAGQPIDLRWPLGIGAGLLVLASPAVVRMILRRRRLSATDSAGKAAGAWRELQASAVDLGMDWPKLTTRQMAARSWPGLDAEGRAALHRLAILIERLRYSPGLPDEVEVAADVALVCTQWRAGASRTQRLVAVVAPRSLVLAARRSS